MACAPSEDSDQPGHPPSLIRVFAVRVKKARVLSYQLNAQRRFRSDYPLNAQRRFRSDWADAQADLSLRWAHMPFCWFCHEAAQLYMYQALLSLSLRWAHMPFCWFCHEAVHISSEFLASQGSLLHNLFV